MNQTAKYRAAQRRWADDPRAKARGGFWFALVLFVASFVINEFLRPKPNIENAKPAGLGDFQFPTATEERYVPILWGTIRISGPNVVWWGDLIQQALTEKIKTGLTSSETVTKGFRYFVGIQSALCRGTVGAMTGFWIGEDQLMSRSGIRNAGVGSGGSGYTPGEIITLSGGVGTAATLRVTNVTGLFNGGVTQVEVVTRGDYTTFPGSPASTTAPGGSGCTISFDSGTLVDGDTFTIDEPELFGGDELGSGGVSGTFKFFAGSDTQAVSSYLALHQQVGSNNKTPAYRGTCHVAPDSEPIYVGNSTTIKQWKYELQRIPNGLSLASSGVVNTYDCNPMNVLYEVLTDTDWGLSIPASKINTASLAAAGATLATEGNGFSYMLDSPIEAAEMIALVEEQVDGILYYDRVAGEFKFTLARADYVVADIPSLDDTTILKFSAFARGSWEDTTNYVRAQYNDREDEYKGTFGLAIDAANIRIQDGAIVNATRAYPGCKSRTLANDLAWRDIRGLAVPLASAEVEVDTTFYYLNPGDPVKITNVDLGITDVAFRITRVDYGELEDGRITLNLIEDVFYYLLGSFGDQGGSGWTPPEDVLEPFLTAETLTFESPRALNARDPKAVSPADNRIFCSARRRSSEVTFKVYTALDGGGVEDFVENDEGARFLRIGELTSDLSTSGDGSATINVTATPDTQGAIRSLFEAGPPTSALGVELSQVIMINGEIMLVTNASDNGVTVDLEEVYRGVLDTTREAHSSGDDVWLLSGADVVGGVTVGPFGETDSIDLRLLPRNLSGTVGLAATAEEEVDMDKRSRRPYPPGQVTIGASSSWNSTVALEQLGGGDEATGFATSWLRRDYRTAEGGNEIDALGTDAASLFGDFPTANSTVYDVRLYDDPDGTPTLLLTYSDLDATSQNQLRIDILKATDGALPTRMRLEIDAEHDDGGETLLARHTLQHDFDVTSTLTGDFEFTALDNGDVSATYTATTAGTFSFNLSTSFSVGDVEYRLNGGSWTTLISAGGTSGSIVGVAISDTIEVRHASTDTTVTKQLDMTAAGAGQDGFAILFT